MTVGADLGEVLPPLAVLVAAVVVVVLTLRAAGQARRPDDPVARLRVSGPVGEWRVDHGPAVDEWLAAYHERFAGLTEVPTGDADADVPEPLRRELDERFHLAAEASPDEELRARLLAVQEAAQSALVAIVVHRPEMAEHEHRAYLEARAEALARLGALGLGRALAVDPKASA
jgi:hypothetical protein